MGERDGSRVKATQAPSVDDLTGLRRDLGVSISVCLPALDEADTIGEICAACAKLLDVGLIQQLLVVDSGSSDGTQEVAARAGAEVYEVRHLLANEAPEPLGKGGALWKSLSVAHGDVIAWVDSDTRNFQEHFVTSLIEALLRDPQTKMAKAYYDRPLISGDGVLPAGGRVTELTFRPLAQILFPELVDLIQPLSGEYAAYRDDLLDVGFFSGYGVETGLMIDFAAVHGVASVAQVDLGARLHNNQDVLRLGRMASEVVQVLLIRAEQQGRLQLRSDWSGILRQFESGPGEIEARDHYIRVRELPPMRSVLSATVARD